MGETLGVAEAKRRFSELIERVSEGETFTVLKHGRPVLALVPAGVAEEQGPPPQGLLAAFGLLADWETMEEDMAEVLAARADETWRPVPGLEG